MDTVTGRLSDFVSNVTYDSLPSEVIEKAKECILDTLGGALAGSWFPDVIGITSALKKYDQQQDCSIWGTRERASLLTAVLLNGTMSHAVEMDDVHKMSKTHAGAVVVPAAITVGEYKHVSGRELISAVVAGYEVMYHIGMGINATAHRLKGWHSTGTCGTFGAAAAASKLFGFDSGKILSALGMAGTQSSSLWAFTEDGSTCKKFHPGKAAQSGILAAILTEGGMTGPRCIIEAEDGGLFPAASYDYNYKVVTQEVGSKWEILKVDRKPFACCRSMHPSIDAILQLKKQTGIQPTDVKKIDVKTYEIAVKQCYFTQQPQNVAEAKFCIPYGVAVTLYDGCAGREQFTSARIADQAVLDLAGKVAVHSDPVFSSMYPKKWGCELTLETTDGKKYVKRIDTAKGDYANPLRFEDLVDKFQGLAQGVLPTEQLRKIIDTVSVLDEMDDVAELASLLKVME